MSDSWSDPPPADDPPPANDPAPEPDGPRSDSASGPPSGSVPPSGGQAEPADPSGGYAPPPGGPQDPGQDIAESGPEPASGRRRSGLIVGLTVALVLLLAGGVFAVTRFLGPTGAQPAEALPGDAAAYLRIDLRPGGEQMLRAYQYLKEFPAVAEQLSDEDGEDLRRMLFDAFEGVNQQLADANVDYAEDIEPWLGHRAAVALLPGAEGEAPRVALALQVTDEAGAREGLEKAGVENVAFSGGYALALESGVDAEEFTASIAEKSLSEDETFASDMATLEGQGVGSIWVDSDAVMDMMASITGTSAPPLEIPEQGRSFGTLRFEENAAVFASGVRGADLPTVDASPNRAGDLPDSTIAALSVGGAEQWAEAMWSQFTSVLESNGPGTQVDAITRAAERDLGLRIPEDLVTLLDDELSLAVDRSLLQNLQAPVPTGVGVRLATDDGQAVPIMRQLLALAQSVWVSDGSAEIPFDLSFGGGRLVAATDEDYASTLYAGGELGEQESFTAAVPDAEAEWVMYVDLAALRPLIEQAPNQTLVENTEPLRSFGISGSTNDDGDQHVTARLVIK